MTFQIKILENWYFDKRLPQMDKSYFNFYRQIFCSVSFSQIYLNFRLIQNLFFDIAQKANLIFIKIVFFQVGIESFFFQNIQDLSNCNNISLSRVFIIDENINQIYNDKNIKLLKQNFINIALKTCCNLDKLKNITRYL